MNSEHRFLFVTDSQFPLGITRQMTCVARELASAGCEVHIASTEKNPTLRPGLSPLGIVTHNIRHSEKRDLGQPFRLRKLVDSLRPNFVHAWGQNAVSLAGLGLGVRTRKSQSRELVFIASYFSKPKAKPVARQLFEGKFCRAPDAILVSHDSLCETLTQDRHWPGLDDEQFHVVPNAAQALGLDKDTIAPIIKSELGIPPESFLAATVGTMTPAARMKDLIWTAALIGAFRDDVHLMIIGDGPQKWRLKKYVHQTCETNCVHFIESPCRAAEHLASADFLWHSHLIEPNPTAVLTAMANQTPVICTYARETEDVIIPQQTGLATNYGAKDEFARWTKYLIEQVESAKQLAKQGREHVEAKFSTSQSLNRYREIYELGAPKTKATVGRGESLTPETD